MKNYLIWGLLLTALMMLVACGPKAPSAEQAFKSADDNFSKAATPQEKIRIARDFLTAFPDGPHTSECRERLHGRAEATPGGLGAHPIRPVQGQRPCTSEEGLRDFPSRPRKAEKISRALHSRFHPGLPGHDL